MPTVLSPEIKNLIDRPNFAHLATLMPDGAPNVTPVWIGREGDQIVICMAENSLKRWHEKALASAVVQRWPGGTSNGKERDFG